MNEEYLKRQFPGERTLLEMINKWNGISRMINNLNGKLCTNEISRLITTIDTYTAYRRVKIAVMLEEKDSYNTRFFDSITKTMKLNVKHFTEEEEAKVWLTRK